MSRAGMDSEPECQGVSAAVDRMTNKMESVKTTRGQFRKYFNSMAVLPEALPGHQAAHLGANSCNFGVLPASCSSRTCAWPSPNLTHALAWLRRKVRAIQHRLEENMLGEQ